MRKILHHAAQRTWGVVADAFDRMPRPHNNRDAAKILPFALGPANQTHALPHFPYSQLPWVNYTRHLALHVYVGSMSGWENEHQKELRHFEDSGGEWSLLWG